MLEKMFKLKENNTTVKTEVLAGITTFMTMAYILAVNPSMLAAAGMDKTAVLMATCIASFIGTLAMAMLANYPFALAPGMGLNAYFAYTVCGAMGYDWKIALMAVFAEGLIFIVLSLTNVREAIFNAIPTTLKKGVSVGIGFFIAFLGLQDGHIVVNNDSTLVTIVDFTGDFHTLGIGAILALIGLFIISILYQRCKRSNPHRYCYHMDFRNDRSGSWSLYPGCRSRILFFISGLGTDRFHFFRRDIRTVL